MPLNAAELGLLTLVLVLVLAATRLSQIGDFLGRMFGPKKPPQPPEDKT